MAIGPNLARFDEGAIEFIIRIIHAVATEDGFEATLVEGFVVRHERKSFYQRLNLSPDIGKDRGGICVAAS